MTPFEVILVPTDFDTCAELALDHAVAIARASKARIVILYVCPLPYAGAWSGAMIPDESVIEATRESGRAALAKTIADRASCGVEMTALSMLGDPRACILEALTTTKADLIVMGTHGRRGFSRLLLGSTAEAIVRTSAVPVLTVRSPAAA